MIKTKKGFTLVEIIVVLVILAILAAAAIPTMLGFVEDAKAKTMVSDARAIYVAAQSATVEQYGLDKDNYQIRASSFRDNGQPRGRVSSNMLYCVQNNKSTTKDQSVDVAIAKQILIRLSSLDKSKAQYSFNSTENPLGQYVNDYVKKYRQPGIIVSYMQNGKIDFIEYGYNGYLIRIDGNGCTTSKNGKFSNSPA